MENVTARLREAYWFRGEGNLIAWLSREGNEISGGAFGVATARAKLYEPWCWAPVALPAPAPARDPRKRPPTLRSNFSRFLYFPILSHPLSPSFRYHHHPLSPTAAPITCLFNELVLLSSTHRTPVQCKTFLDLGRMPLSFAPSSKTFHFLPFTSFPTIQFIIKTCNLEASSLSKCIWARKEILIARSL